MNVIVAQLRYLNSQDQKQKIDLYINSPGGSVEARIANAFWSSITTMQWGCTMHVLQPNNPTIVATVRQSAP